MRFGLTLFAITVLFQPVAQLLEKAGLRQIGAITSIGQLFRPSTLLAIVTNPYIVCGVLLSASMLLLWLGALSSLRVSYMFPLGSISYIVMALLAHFFLKEPITASHWAGIFVIVLGCFLINR